jgi:hypothetical protein
MLATTDALAVAGKKLVHIPTLQLYIKNPAAVLLGPMGTLLCLLLLLLPPLFTYNNQNSEARTDPNKKNHDKKRHKIESGLYQCWVVL